MAATSKTEFDKLAQAVSIQPPPRVPEFPPELAKKFPDMAEGLKKYDAEWREFFRQQQLVNLNS